MNKKNIIGKYPDIEQTLWNVFTYSKNYDPHKTKKIHLEKIPDSVNYKVFKTTSKKQLKTILQRIRSVV